jgi:hypothetical protein
MKYIKSKLVLVTLVSLLSCLVIQTPGVVTQASPGPGKFAVLVSTGRTTTDNLMLHSEYWYDLLLTYRMLIENGFTHDHIYVLYGNGTDFASTHAAYQNPYTNPITDYAVTRANIQNIFNWLAAGSATEGIPAMTTNDFLFVWWMGHGNGGAACDTTFSIDSGPESVTDAELATWTGAITYRRRAFVFMTCHSGGAMDNLQNATTVTMPSCTCTENSSSDTYDVVHGEWTYWVDGALRELLPTGAAVNSDTDSSNLVSLQETFNWGSGQPMNSTPQLSDMGSIAPCVFIRLEEPGENVEVFSKDHVNDDGTVPSYYETWYHGPDLWVRHAQDGGATHQEPEYGQTNYVYANVHNIGCVAATNVTVDFSWVAPTGWSNPAMWNLIGTANIASLPVLGSTTVNTPWTSVPLPGAFCLHTRLNVTGDPQNADGRAYWDDNKVQINVTVQDNWAGAGWGWFFFIENGGEEFVPIDLVFDTLDAQQGTMVRLELPPDLKFEDVEGAEVFRGEDEWTVLEILAGTKVPARVMGVQLEPGERRRAILTLTLPKDAEVGEEMIVTFEEQVEGEVMGGIQFVSRAAEPKTVMCGLLREKINVFYSLAEVLGLDEAAKVAEICAEMVASGECGDEDVFVDRVAEIAELEYVIGEKLQEISTEYGPRYVRASERLLKAIDEHNLPVIVEAQQEVLLYASIILTDALTG